MEPAWSWPSIDASVRTHSSYGEYTKHVNIARVMNVGCKIASQDLFGRALGGHVMNSGLCVDAFL